MAAKLARVVGIVDPGNGPAALESRRAAAVRKLNEGIDAIDLITPYHRYSADEWGMVGRSPFGGPWGYAPDRTQPQGNHPAGILTEEEWRQAVVLARSLYERNHLAAGFFDLTTNFVVGDGFTWDATLKGAHAGAVSTGVTDADGDGRPDADPAVAACQEALDEWRAADRWGEGEDDREPECWLRASLEGEVTLRWFRGDSGRPPACRTVEPEFIRTPPGESADGPAGWGVRCADGDAERVLGYWLADPDSPTTAGEWVDAARVTRLKLNAVRTVKRGVPDALPVGDDLYLTRKLLRNMGEVAAVQAAIAFVTQHAPGVTASQVNKLIEQGRDYQAPRPSPIGHILRDDVRHYRAGEHLNLSNGQQFTAGPVSTGAAGFIAVEQALLRALGFRWNAPEFASGDASNNNLASALVAGGPFERACRRRQKRFAGFQQAVALKVLDLCAESGRLPREYVERVTVKVTYPPVAIANRLEEEQINETRCRNGVLSVQTWMSLAGLDAGVELANIRAHKEQFPDQSGGMLDLGGGGTFGESLLREEVGPPPFPGAVFDRGKHRWVRGAADRVRRGVGRADAKAAETLGVPYTALKSLAKRAEAAMSVVMVRTQAVAKRAAQERGHPLEHVERVGRVLAAADFAASFAVSKGVTAATGGNALAGFAGGMLPTASVGYLLYSTARNPAATLRAAKAYLKGDVAVGHHKEATDPADADALLSLFAASANADWAEAVVFAALDATGGDVPKAVEQAAEVLKDHPTQDVTESIGPPPFPGAVFDRSKHRWVKPAGAKVGKKGGMANAGTVRHIGPTGERPVAPSMNAASLSRMRDQMRSYLPSSDRHSAKLPELVVHPDVPDYLKDLARLVVAQAEYDQAKTEAATYHLKNTPPERMTREAFIDAVAHADPDQFPDGLHGMFFRSGDLPPGGRSRNSQTGEPEAGVSVYPLPRATSLAGLADRPWHFGPGEVVGKGSDDEPIIKPGPGWSRLAAKDKDPAAAFHKWLIANRKAGPPADEAGQ